MNQENATRLKEEFRFAARGARCRSATFINPNFASLDQCEWMEAECANGKSWDIKIMKFTPSANPDEEGEIEQAYLEAHRDISFGAVILKLTEYQQGQKALGFLLDADDTGQIAGAPLFRPVAEKTGIAFDVDANPVAPVKGLITLPGRYPASAFNKAQSALADFAKPSYAATGGTLSASTALAPVRVELSMDEVLRRKKIVGILTTLTEAVREMKKNPLGWCTLHDFTIFFISGTKYQDMARTFDESYAKIQKIMESQSNGEPDDFADYIKDKLVLFEFHTFQIAAASIIDLFGKDGQHAQNRKSNSSLKDSIRRCEVAWKKINPEAEMAREKVFNPSRINTRILSGLVAEISDVIEGKPVAASARDRKLVEFNP